MDSSLNYKVIEKTSNDTYQALWVEIQFDKKVILFVELYTGNTIQPKTLCGAPQGSALGPFLFLLYINDIYNSSEKFRFYLFADDTNLLYADKSLRSLENTVDAELSNVSKWLTNYPKT